MTCQKSTNANDSMDEYSQVPYTNGLAHENVVAFERGREKKRILYVQFNIYII